MSIQLKIKFKSLSEEARIIKSEERKFKRVFKNEDQLEARREKARNGFLSIRGHRLRTVRREARATHLARAFIKGMPYTSVEQSFAKSNEPDVYRIAEMVKKYMKDRDTGNRVYDYDENGRQKAARDVRDWIISSVQSKEDIAA